MNVKRLTLILVVVLMVLLTGCTNTEAVRVNEWKIEDHVEDMDDFTKALEKNAESNAFARDPYYERAESTQIDARMSGEPEPVIANIALGVENKWRNTYTRLGGMWGTNFVITFEPGDKCTLTVYSNPRANSFAYTILVKDDTYDNYLVAIDSLDEGYTIDDLKAYKPAHIPPRFANLISYHAVDPDSTTFLGEVHNIEPGDYYITCQVQGPDSHKNLEVLGPVHVNPPFGAEP